MTTTRSMQSALRAALKKEDAALEKRLPEAGLQTTGASVETSPEKARTRRETQAEPKATVKSRPKAVRRRIAQPLGADGPAAAPSSVPAAPTPAAQASASVAPGLPAADPLPQKPEKRIQESFAMSRQDLLTLKEIKARIKRMGHKASRSELVRAAIVLLSRQSDEEVQALTDCVPPLRKTGRRKK